MKSRQIDKRPTFIYLEIPNTKKQIPMKNLFKPIIVAILTFEAKLVLAKFRPRVVALTGSVGKTSTKDAVYSVLAKKFFVRRSEKSFNSEIGIPLTILGLQNAWANPWLWLWNLLRGLVVIMSRKPYPEWLVLEVGADRPGDIQKVAKWLKTEVVVFTRFGKVPVHIEFFKSREELIAEKMSLLSSLSRDGVIIANSDDEDIVKAIEKSENRVTTFGLTGDSNVSAANIKICYAGYGRFQFPKGICGDLKVNARSFPINVSGTIGTQQAYPILAAAAVGVSQGLELSEIAEAITDHESPPGRMRLISGIKETMIIDDSYNSSPVAVKSALETLFGLEVAGRKIAVLGDMLELGRHSADEHREIGAMTKDADLLITVGVRARGFAEGALSAGLNERKVLQFEDSISAAKEIQNLLAPGDVILVKGSQGVRMEKIVEEIMAEPDKRAELLVRQDEEWGKR
ncbi:MAG: UDP-N-acetylmuramoyl-tripeptide--D-alanyl-D-alanine ligase [Candidatus Paceibacterota bacterium]|jgi:UDP-N-acetylmuramoyl-tripeptide--D-alanyl-D-alanine ligase